MRMMDIGRCVHITEGSLGLRGQPFWRLRLNGGSAAMPSGIPRLLTASAGTASSMEVTFVTTARVASGN